MSEDTSVPTGDVPAQDEAVPAAPSKLAALKVKIGAILSKVVPKKGPAKVRIKRRDPGTLLLNKALWTVVLVSWAVVGFLGYQIFGKSYFKGLGHLSEFSKDLKEDSNYLYSWTKGFAFGHDIVEPDIEANRGLAAAINDMDLKISMGARYIEFGDIEAVVKAGMGNHSKVLLSMAIEVDGYPAEQEVLKKELKIRELVALELSTKDKELLMQVESIAELKEEILQKLDLVITSGPVTDVLITAIAYN